MKEVKIIDITGQERFVKVIKPQRVWNLKGKILALKGQKRLFNALSGLGGCSETSRRGKEIYGCFISEVEYINGYPHNYRADSVKSRIELRDVEGIASEFPSDLWELTF